MPNNCSVLHIENRGENRYEEAMRLQTTLKIGALLALVADPAILLATPHAPGRQVATALTRPPTVSKERLPVDFREAPLTDVVRFVSQAVGINIILDPPSLGGHKVTVIAPRPVPVDELVPLLRAALRHAGLIVSPRGAYLLIRSDPDHVPSKRRSSKGR